MLLVAISLVIVLVTQITIHNVLFVALLCLSFIPRVISHQQKEKLRRIKNIDIWYLTCWCSIFQFIFGLLTLPLLFINVISRRIIIFEDIMSYISLSLLCLFGSNSSPTDQCEESPLIFVIYIFVNIVQNFLMLNLMKRKKLTLIILAFSLRLVLTFFGFQFVLISGVSWAHVDFTDAIAIGLQMFSFLLYYYNRHQFFFEYE